MTWTLGIAGLLLLAALAYWQLIIAEGAYLGRRVVTWLYDVSATAYERIKQFDTDTEQWFLGLPLAQALDHIPAPLVLDVGTGTGRLPRALLFQPRFAGQVVGLDLSRRMLEQAVRLTAAYAGRVTWIWQDAQVLPFGDGVFDAVTCLEALEFTPSPRGVLGELVRVLRPGGVLVVSNRIGSDAPLLPGRAFRGPTFEALLRDLALESVYTQAWQMDYDLVWAVKAGPPRGGGARPLADLLCCPACGHGPLVQGTTGYGCVACGCLYPVTADGVIEMARPRPLIRSD